MTHVTRNLLAAVTLAVLVAFAPAPAGAIVPPRDCKYMTVKGKRYNIKADQLRCTSARRYADRYLRTRRKPSGYRCTRGDSGSKLAFNCVNSRANPDRRFFAIKR